MLTIEAVWRELARTMRMLPSCNGASLSLATMAPVHQCAHLTAHRRHPIYPTYQNPKHSVHCKQHIVYCTATIPIQLTKTQNTLNTAPGLHESLQPCSRAARKWRENEEMKRKRRGNGERMRKWRENEEINREWGNGKRMRKSTENEEMERGWGNRKGNEEMDREWRNGERFPIYQTISSFCFEITLLLHWNM